MISPSEIIFKLFLGTVIGGIIGFERQTHGRPAGFRTQLLVCVACVLLMIISEDYYLQGINSEWTRIDPMRIAAGAMTGVGFLGAGVILKTGATIQGLTTAACIWIVSAIGLAIGAGQYVAGITGAVITFISLWLLRIVETKMPRLTYKYITVVTDTTGEEERFYEIFRQSGFELAKTDYEIEIEKGIKTFMFSVSSKDGRPMKDIIEKIMELTSVKKIGIKG